MQSARHQQHEPEVPGEHLENPVRPELGAALERGLEPEPGDCGEHPEREQDRPDERTRQEVPERGERARRPDEDRNRLEGERRMPCPAGGAIGVGRLLEGVRRELRARHALYLRTFRRRPCIGRTRRRQRERLSPDRVGVRARSRHRVTQSTPHRARARAGRGTGVPFGSATSEAEAAVATCRSPMPGQDVVEPLACLQKDVPGSETACNKWTFSSDSLPVGTSGAGITTVSRPILYD